MNPFWTASTIEGVLPNLCYRKNHQLLFSQERRQQHCILQHRHHRLYALILQGLGFMVSLHLVPSWWAQITLHLQIHWKNLHLHLLLQPPKKKHPLQESFALIRLQMCLSTRKHQNPDPSLLRHQFHSLVLLRHLFQFNSARPLQIPHRQHLQRTNEDHFMVLLVVLEKTGTKWWT